MKNVSVLGFHTLAICDVVLFSSKMSFHEDVPAGRIRKVLSKVFSAVVMGFGLPIFGCPL